MKNLLTALMVLAIGLLSHYAQAQGTPFTTKGALPDLNNAKRKRNIY